MNNLNQLSSVRRTGTLTVAGSVGQAAAPVSVTVSATTGLSTGPAEVYPDGTWAREGAVPTDSLNTYTATATDANGHTGSATVSVNLPQYAWYYYDVRGNLTNDGLRSFEYDYENQLTAVFAPGGWRSEFVYDGLGRRRIRKEYTWTGTWTPTNEVHYVYDGRVVLQERDANNTPQVTYTRGNDLSGELQEAGGIGGLLARSDSSGHAFYHCDAQGNIVRMFNATGQTVARYTYDPFGNIQTAIGPLASVNLYRFSSKEYHQNSGLVYYLYRYYDPNLQRWINRDPIEEMGGINAYSFLLNSATAYVDVWGLEIIPVNCEAEWKKAKAYLIKSETAKQMIDKMEQSKEKYYIDKFSGDTYVYKDGRIKWDPNLAVATRKGKGQSPASTLLHELRHKDRPGDNEEQVTDFQNTCAKQLPGEGTRENYEDTDRFFRVDDVTKTGPIPPRPPLRFPSRPGLTFPPEDSTNRPPPSK